MTSPLINAALIPAATPGAAARKPDAQAYAAAMREAGSKATVAAGPGQQPAPQPAAAASFSRESPFGSEPSRPMRPGSILDIRV